MGWKNWAYWVRGGVIGLIYSLIIALWSLKIVLTASDSTSSGFALIFLNLFLNFPSYFIFSLLVDLLPYVDEMLAMVIISFPINFIIFAIIGWLYGKIKNR